MIGPVPIFHIRQQHVCVHTRCTYYVGAGPSYRLQDSAAATKCRFPNVLMKWPYPPSTWGIEDMPCEREEKGRTVDDPKMEIGRDGRERWQLALCKERPAML